jgi:endonuclease-3
MYTLKQRKQRAKIIIAELKKLFPEAKTVLNYSNPHELLFAVILSAQCTDKLVNKVTANLFQKYKTLDEYAAADPAEFEKDISSVNFYRNKAKNILATAKLLKEKYNGKVPEKMDDLLSLPGVARKTANVIMASVYNNAEGVVVDTHVRRISKVYGLTEHEDPVKVEKDLMEILPKEEWRDLSFRVIDYGRAYCTAKPHDHANCPLVKVLSSV